MLGNLQLDSTLLPPSELEQGTKIHQELLNMKPCHWLESLSYEQLFLHVLCSDSSLSSRGEQEQHAFALTWFGCSVSFHVGQLLSNSSRVQERVFL